MASLSRRRAGQSLDIWPGFVDVLATLLIIVIFVLLVFVLAQVFLGQALSGRDAALDRLRAEVAQYEDLLAIERQANADLRADVAQLSGDLQAANARWEALIGTARASEATELELAEALDLVERQRQEIAALEGDRRTLAERLQAALGQVADREAALVRREDRIAALEAAEERLAADLEAAYATIEADAETLEARLADLARLEAQVADLTETRDRLRAELEAANRTIRVDKETIETSLAQLARLRQDVEALTALRDDLEDRIRSMDRQLSETEGALAEEQRISEQARAQAAMLNAQLKRVRTELARLNDLLEAKEAESEAQQATIANLGQRLNAALATKVQELQRYRSEFFGRLRAVLGDREGIRVEGDRFVFQSEVLFGVGEATLGPAGRDDLADLADTLMSVAQQFPPGIDWILRVDGHTDKRPISTPRFANNWELSTARAISVVQFLIDQGVPPERLAAAGFAEHRPVAAGDTEQAYARNRRIELKLDQR
ncbi:peptidoglycan -binding protein [Roseospira goensis]|uniref:Chemotaxis protein MotB n=1 Tax=Roseospira goensis TaxID=391922 RepID=A0A7W6RWT0_9PROT|nr:peptidoglycan -binding protein [Roseospira goensis]MBB4284688.1 chemotaxis protein MotB [Roseospira goensis]